MQIDRRVEITMPTETRVGPILRAQIRGIQILYHSHAVEAWNLTVQTQRVLIYLHVIDVEVFD
jgi:hypothetical protein